MAIKFQVTGHERLLRKLATLRSQARRNITSKALTSGGRVLREVIRVAAPVRKEPYWPKRAKVRRRGELRRTIRVVRDINLTAGIAVVRVGYSRGWNAGIAAMLEKGTVDRFTGTSKGKRLYDLKTKQPKRRGYRGRVSARHWFSRASKAAEYSAQRAIGITLESEIRKVLLRG